ncbi:hypothetical protein ABT317_21580, partial [Streptomyces carpinensis]
MVSQSGPVTTGVVIAWPTRTPRRDVTSSAHRRSAPAAVDTNRPMSISHSPPVMPLKKTSHPTAARAMPMTCPLRPAARWARS